MWMVAALQLDGFCIMGIMPQTRKSIIGRLVLVLESGILKSQKLKDESKNTNNINQCSNVLKQPQCQLLSHHNCNKPISKMQSKDKLTSINEPTCRKSRRDDVTLLSFSVKIVSIVIEPFC